MRTASFVATSLIILGMLVGCGSASREIQGKSQNEKTGVFQEVAGETPMPKGFADLIIKSNIKTHVEDYYILESRDSPHGRQTYPFLLNIGGQVVRWDIEGVRDVKPSYDAEGKTNRDPEAGEGIKYDLKKTVRLHAGTHRVMLCQSGDDYCTEVSITLKEGETAALAFEPVYRTKRIPTRIPSFLKGIDKYEVFLNGERLI